MSSRGGEGSQAQDPRRPEERYPGMKEESVKVIEDVRA
jgi:hypothetical protein